MSARCQLKRIWLASHLTLNTPGRSTCHYTCKHQLSRACNTQKLHNSEINNSSNSLFPQLLLLDVIKPKIENQPIDFTKSINNYRECRCIDIYRVHQ